MDQKKKNIKLMLVLTIIVVIIAIISVIALFFYKDTQIKNYILKRRF